MKNNIKKYIYLFIYFTSLSCTTTTIEEYQVVNNELQINLKWNKSYQEDTFDKNKIALDWFLSYLGGKNSVVTSQNEGLIYKNPIIILNIEQAGFSEKAITVFKNIHSQIKETEEYKINKTIDLGRYITLILGNTNYYYSITGISNNLNELKQKYSLETEKGYVNNSSISKVHRKIAFSNYKNNSQLFLAEEIDSITEEVLEFETLEIMENGQLLFGIFDKNGRLKESASTDITSAGKPGKCMWCHEVNILPFFTVQKDYNGYLSYTSFQETLKASNKELRKYQDEVWTNKRLMNKQNHMFMEIAYISYLEPSIERIVNEWNMTEQEVEVKLRNITTHKHKEFGFLGDLYNRKDIDAVAPFKSVNTPKSVRETVN